MLPLEMAQSEDNIEEDEETEDLNKSVFTDGLAKYSEFFDVTEVIYNLNKKILSLKVECKCIPDDNPLF